MKMTFRYGCPVLLLFMCFEFGCTLRKVVHACFDGINTRLRSFFWKWNAFAVLRHSGEVKEALHNWYGAVRLRSSCVKCAHASFGEDWLAEVEKDLNFTMGQTLEAALNERTVLLEGETVTQARSWPLIVL